MDSYGDYRATSRDRVCGFAQGMEVESRACGVISRTGVAIWLFGLSLLAGATAWGGSPIQNPGFEAVDGDGQPVAWRGGVTHHAGKTFTGSAVADAEVVHSGRYSAQGSCMVEQGPVRVKPRTRYRLSVWMLMPDRGWPLLEVRCGEGKRVLAGNNFGGDAEIAPWTLVALEFDTGEHSEITVRAGDRVSGDGYWLDDFELVEDPSIRLGDLSAADPAPEASADEVARGYVVFDRHWMERVSSAAKPGAGERTESLSLRLTPGEYGPLTVAVYALRDLQDLRVTPAGPLSGPGGRAISPEHVDVRAARMSRFSFSSTQWEEYPLFLLPAEPAEIQSDTTRLFWLTVQAPEDAPAGVYKGAVRVQAGNAPDREVPLSVQVLPFRLLIPPVSFAMYAGVGPQYQEKHHYRRFYEDLKAHGMTGAMHFGGIGTRHADLTQEWFSRPIGNEPWSWQEHMETLVDVGLPAAGFPVVTFNMKNVPSQGGQSYPLYKQHRRSGWPELLHYVQDEIGDAKRIRSAKWLLGFYTHPDIRKVSTTTAWELGRLYDEWIAYYTTVADPESEVLKRARRWGRDVGVYECNRGGNNPVFDRYSAGLYTWKTGIKSNWIWIYILGERMFALASPDGPVPTVGWEARREGIDDYRYLHTLDVMARKAAASDGFGPENALVRESCALLDSMGKRIDAEGAFQGLVCSGECFYNYDPQPDMRPGDYDRMRARVADQVLKLHTAGIRADEAAGAPARVAAKTTAEERRLHEAAVKGDLETAAGLLAGGVDVNARDEAWRWTPLHQAAERGHAQVVELFLKAGADQTARDRMGWTPLQVAAERGHLPVVELLLKAGSEPDLLDERGRTPLMYAAYTKRPEVARKLRERGADVNAADDDGHAVLHWAVFNNHADMARLLLERGAEVDAAGREGMTALHWAARWVHGSHETEPAVKALLEAGAALDPRDAHGWTPLHWAVLMGDVMGTEIIELLVEGGADANVGDEDGRTPLHFTAHMEGDYGESARLLLARGADVTAGDKDGNTPLHLAAARGHAGLCVMLLKSGADVNARNAEGRTPLHLAARDRRPMQDPDDLDRAIEVADVLLEHGAARDLRDNEGKTPLEYLMVKGKYMRQEHRAKIRSLLLEE